MWFNEGSTRQGMKLFITEFFCLVQFNFSLLELFCRQKQSLAEWLVRKVRATRWKIFASHYLLTLLYLMANWQKIDSLPYTLMMYNQRIFEDILICILLLRRVIQQRSTQKSKMQIHWHLSCLCAIRSLSLSSLPRCGFPCWDVAVTLQNIIRALRCDHFHHSARRGVCSVDASSSLQCFDKVYGEWFAITSYTLLMKLIKM